MVGSYEKGRGVKRLGRRGGVAGGREGRGVEQERSVTVTYDVKQWHMIPLQQKLLVRTGKHYFGPPNRIIA